MIFQVLPITFNSIPGGLGWLWNGFFFVLLAIAALTSGISLLECGVATVMQHLKISRQKAVIGLTVIISAFALLSCWSVADWSSFPTLEKMFKGLFGAVKGNFLDQLDYICSCWILPLDGLLIAIFAGWIWGVGKCSRELYRRGGNMPLTLENTAGLRDKLNMRLPVRVWAVFVRFIAPLLTLLTFLYAAGLVKF